MAAVTCILPWNFWYLIVNDIHVVTSVNVLQSAIKAKLVELGAYVGEYFNFCKAGGYAIAQFFPVCLQDYWEGCWWIIMKFEEWVCLGSENTRIRFLRWSHSWSSAWHFDICSHERCQNHWSSIGLGILGYLVMSACENCSPSNDLEVHSSPEYFWTFVEF